MSSRDNLAHSPTQADALPTDEAAAIAASYERGRFTTYYVDCARLPCGELTAMRAPPNSATSMGRDLHNSAAAASLLTLGDFSMLPYPEYANRRGKILNRPLYHHHLKS
ncbi:hypothetical protein JKF63_03587 [Porcisia hertigi]|uniref:Uncharacterized protein n=1 Tax=Porcisia hertigi TaxID=2761500 RepID=A0A836IH34_9TRYP|nr:hypothetical protein JKF63_03587 [Porcisia hertigi]